MFESGNNANPVARVESVTLSPEQMKLRELTYFKKTTNSVGQSLLFQILFFTIIPYIVSRVFITVIVGMYAAGSTKFVDSGDKIILVSLIISFVFTSVGNLAALIPAKKNFGLRITNMITPDRTPTTTFLKPGKLIHAFIMAIGIGQIGAFAGTLLQNIIPGGEDSNFGLNDLGSGAGMGGVIITSMLVSVVAPILEEFLFRGAILMPLRRYGDKFAIIISSLLFGLVHGNLQQIPFAFAMGLVLGYVTVKSDSILPSIIIHFLNNFKSNILLFMFVAYDIDITSISDNSILPEPIMAVTGAISIATLIAMIYAIIKLIRHQKWMSYDDRFTIPKNFIPDKKYKRFFLTPTVLIAVIVHIATFISSLL